MTLDLGQLGQVKRLEARRLKEQGTIIDRAKEALFKLAVTNEQVERNNDFLKAILGMLLLTQEGRRYEWDETKIVDMVGWKLNIQNADEDGVNAIYLTEVEKKEEVPSAEAPE